MLLSTTVDSAMPMSLVSWSAAMRPGTMSIGKPSDGSIHRLHLYNALTGLECRWVGLNSLNSRSVSHRAVGLAGVPRGGIRPFSAAIVEQQFGGMTGDMALNADRNPESVFVSKVTYGRSHVPVIRRRRGEG